MSRLTLVFTICSVIIAGAHFALVNGEAAPDQLESQIDDQEEASGRSALADARAHPYGNINGPIRLRPLNPQPSQPSQPLKYPFPPVNATSCYSCRECEKVDSSTLSLYCKPYQNTGCVTYSTSNAPPGKKQAVFRGCISDLGTCKDIRKNWLGLGVILSCTECQGNDCNNKNGAGSAVPNHSIAAMAMLAAPILSKFFFSRI